MISSSQIEYSAIADQSTRPYMEDHMLYRQIGHFLFACVFDGHDDAMCSRFFRDRLLFLFETIPPHHLYREYITSLYHLVSLEWTIKSSEIRSAKKKNWKSESESGTTFTGVIVDVKSHICLAFNVGDSGVLITGAQKGIHFASIRPNLDDKSLRDRLNSKVDYNCTVKEDGEWRVVSKDGSASLNMSSCCGDLYMPGISIALDRRLDTNLFRLRLPCNIAIYSDGISDVMDQQEITNLIHEGKNAQEFINIANERDKQDNVTMILIHFRL
jgi:serine/threonine protein phosphatase PrpC